MIWSPANQPVIFPLYYGFTRFGSSLPEAAFPVRAHAHSPVRPPVALNTPRADGYSAALYGLVRQQSESGLPNGGSFFVRVLFHRRPDQFAPTERTEVYLKTPFSHRNVPIFLI